MAGGCGLIRYDPRVEPEDVRSREDLVAYLRQLLKELEEIGPNYNPSEAFFKSIQGWYNLSLRDFLEAMTAAVDNSAVRSAGRTWMEHPESWQAIATAILMGKVYE